MKTKGEVYVAKESGNIHMWDETDSQYYLGGLDGPNKTFRIGRGVFKDNDDKLATPDEKAWLMACIKAGKYLSRDQIPQTRKEFLIWN